LAVLSWSRGASNYSPLNKPAKPGVPVKKLFPFNIVVILWMRQAGSER
jgi:hypothetical protein